MRDVKSKNYYEQMKGRGCRSIPADDLRSVTPNAVCKSKFILIDAVGVTESKKAVPPPLERKKSVPLKKLIEEDLNMQWKILAFSDEYLVFDDGSSVLWSNNRRCVYKRVTDN